MTFVRGLGSSFGHVVGHHVESGAKGRGNITELHMMSKHMHAHVHVPGGGLVCRVQTHGDGAFVVHVDVE